MADPNEKPKLSLQSVPQILDQLVIDKKLDAEQKGAAQLYVDVLKAKTPEEGQKLLDAETVTPLQRKKVEELLATGKRMFAGEAVEAMGFADNIAVQDALGNQAAAKASAAASDLALIAEKGKVDHPPFLKANWGNGGVNPSAKEPTVTDGTIAAANVAQNIVMLVNDGKPELAGNETIQKGVAAAAKLAEGIAGKVKLSEDEIKTLTEDAKVGLKFAAQETGMGPKDKEGKDLTDDFIAARFAEVEAGAAKRIEIQKETERAMQQMKTEMGGAQRTDDGGAIPGTASGVTEPRQGGVGRK